MRPSVVICGTFHQDLDGLKRLFRRLEEASCRVLSPISLDFIDTSKEVVTTKNEFDFTIGELEKQHLRAIRDADFIWLHTPGGHVGISTSYELGYADALQKPSFCFTTPTDAMIATRVKTVRTVSEALEYLNLTSAFRLGSKSF